MIRRRGPIEVLVLAAALLGAVVLLGGLASAAHHPRPKTKRVSVNSRGKGGPYGSDFPSTSGDGKFVCFESLNHFTKGDSGIDQDVFVHNRKSGKTSRASLKSNGKEASGAANSDSCSMSGDGRFVAFRSDASLVGKDQNGANDIYRRDRKTGKTRLVSVKSNGTQVNYDSADPRISANGRFVVWDTDGPFSDGDTNSTTDVYRRDMKTGKTVRASIRNDGSQPNDESELPSVSADGRFVAFQSYDGAMTADTDYQFLVDFDVFVRDLRNHKTIRASLSSNGNEPSYPNQSPPSNVSSTNATISANGKFVAFVSFGVYNGHDDNLNGNDVFIRNLAAHRTSVVSVKSNGQQATGSSGYTDPYPLSISSTGRYVAFDSLARLTSKDTDGVGDVYRRDRIDHKTILASVKSNGNPLGSTDAALPGISLDGHWVAFASQDPYSSADKNHVEDIYERGRLP